MNSFVLILTFVSYTFSGTTGGVSMAEFNTKAACLQAGHKWRMTISPEARKYSTIICAPKGVTQ